MNGVQVSGVHEVVLGKSLAGKMRGKGKRGVRRSLSKTANRLTPNGTMVIANIQLNKVVEYDLHGNELWSFPLDVPRGVTPLSNGNFLITDRIGVREITRHGDAVWTFAQSDVPDYRFSTFQQAWRLSNGNTVVSNWVNEWNTKSEERTGTCRRWS